MEIYKIQNKKNKKIYIGLSVQGWKVRCNNHKSEARRGCDFKLHRAIRKYGEENFDFDRIEVCETLTQLKEREKFWIKLFKSNQDEFGYNMTEGGDGTFGRKHSEETKRKLSESAINSESFNHVPIECINCLTGDVFFFKKIKDASLFFKINERTFYNNFKKRKWKMDHEMFTLIRRDDLKPSPKPKKTKRDPNQVKQHMLNMQKASNESRKNNEVWKDKIKETKAKRGFTKIVQQFDLENNLIAEYNGSRDVVLNNPEFKRSGIQHCLKGRNKTYKGFVWKFKE